MTEIGLGHYLSLGAIIFFLGSKIKIGAQSAVTIPHANFFRFVIRPSPILLILKISRTLITLLL